MDLRQIECFLTLAETLNFSHSANRLYISRQGLSKSISSLEKELEVMLFKRGANKICLTENGEIFCRYAWIIFSNYQEMLQELRKRQERSRSAVPFLMPIGFWGHISINMIYGFFEHNPGLSYLPVTARDSELMRLFQRGEYEFALFSGSSLPEEVAAIPLFKNYRCILLNEDHPLAAQPAIRTRDLAGETVLALSEGYDYGWLQELCLRNNVEINLIPVNDTMTIFSSPGSSRILSLSAGTLDGSRRLPEGVVYRFWAAEELQETAFQVSVCLFKGRELPEHTRALIDYMIDFCAKIVRDNSSYPYRLPD